MHVMIGSGSLQGGGPSPQTVAAIEAALAGHPFTRAFPGMYVVTVAQEADRLTLVQALTATTKAADVNSLLLVSPLIPPSSGTYNGLLPTGLWTELNSRVV